MLEQEDQLNEETAEESAPITGVDEDPEDEPMTELPENKINENDDLEELQLGER